jgi:hypothetical protein
VGAWKWLLPALCAVALLALCAQVFETLGLGGRAWFGYWDALPHTTGQPFVVEFVEVIPDGAARRVGIRAGDGVDLRTTT